VLPFAGALARPPRYQWLRRQKHTRLAVALFIWLLITALWVYAAQAAGRRAAPSTSGDVREAARKALEARIGEQLQPLVPPETRLRSVSLGCSAGPDTQLKAVAPGVSQLSSPSITVELEHNGRTRLCSALVALQHRVLRAARDIPPGQELSAADFTSGWADAASLAPGALSSFSLPAPRIAAVFIPAGAPVYANQLVRPVAIRAGELVSVLVRNGPVTLKTRMQARSNAAVGDNTVLLNPAGATAVTVRVTGPHSAELLLQ
jgi:flagella basal body P-ring formation protein FlgA